MTEMNKLMWLLENANIPYEIAYQDWTDSIQVWYPSKENPVCDAICNRYSYGGKEGLLEIMGLLTDKESEYNSVVGWLTAGNVFTRIFRHYYDMDKEADR